jgi:S-adenosylmethionine hydrolase
LTRRQTIAILTDFGISDNYNGVMEGVIRKINPNVNVTYITPNAKNFNIVAGAYLLYTAYKYFPKYTIFLTVIDPGVGTSRKPIIIKTKNYYFVGPDNGILYPSASEDGILKIVSITNRKLYLSKQISNTFHGRDIFSVAAAFLSTGVRIEIFGEEVKEEELAKLLFNYTKETVSKDKIKACGKVIYIDHFGNVTTSIRINNLKVGEEGKIFVSNKEFKAKIVRTFGEGSGEEVLIYRNGYFFIEVGINKGDASNILKVKEGDDICVEVYIQEDFNHSI